jgi:hypothetical protein
VATACNGRPVIVELSPLLYVAPAVVDTLIPTGRRSLYIYIKKDGNPFIISTRHVKANINTRQ